MIKPRYAHALLLAAFGGWALGCVSYRGLAYSETDKRMFVAKDTSFLGIGSSEVLVCSVPEPEPQAESTLPASAECSPMALHMVPAAAPPAAIVAAPVPQTEAEPEPVPPAPPPTTAAPAPAAPKPPAPAAPVSCSTTESQVSIACPTGTGQIMLCTAKDGRSCRFIVQGQVIACAPNCDCGAAKTEAEQACKR